MPIEVLIDRVEKRYSRTLAISVENVALGPGDRVVLFGRNGAGKSTFLKLLAGLLRPSRGEVRLNGVDQAKLPRSFRRRIGYLGHSPFLYGDLTGRENLRFFARLFALDRVETRVADFLEVVELASHADRPVRVYSRGMTQRLALARALIHDPEFLLLDEPFSGLDKAGEAWLAARLEAIGRDERTLVFSDQNVDRGLACANRSFLFHRGKIFLSLLDGSDDEMRKSFRSRCLELLGGGHS